MLQIFFSVPQKHALRARAGFYGKGLFDNEMMINSVIGRRPEPEADGSYKALEALPVRGANILFSGRWQCVVGSSEYIEGLRSITAVSS